MSKKTKIWLIVATSLVFLGLIMFSSVMTAFNWEFSKLNTVKYETNTHQVDEEFSNISIKTDTADIHFFYSEDGTCKIVCNEKENENHSVYVKDGTLIISVVDEKLWYEYIGISFYIPSITVYLPKNEYASLFIKESTGDIDICEDFKFDKIDITTSTGDISIEKIKVGMLGLSVSTGKVAVTDVICENDMKIKVSTGKTDIKNTKCKNLISSGSTGNIVLKNVVASELFSIERSTGDVRFERCDASEMLVKTDTGDVTGTFLTDKEFIAQTDTGRIDVPKSTGGGRCEITTDTGDIKIDITP